MDPPIAATGAWISASNDPILAPFSDRSAYRRGGRMAGKEHVAAARNAAPAGLKGRAGDCP